MVMKSQIKINVICFNRNPNWLTLTLTVMIGEGEPKQFELIF